MKKLLLSLIFISVAPMVASQKLADISMFFPVEEEEQTEIDTVKRSIGRRLEYLKSAQDALRDDHVLANIKMICIDIFNISKLLKINTSAFIESLEAAIKSDLSDAKDYIVNPNLTDQEQERYLKDWCDVYFEKYLQFFGKGGAINKLEDFYEWLIIKDLAKDFRFAD